MHIIHILLTFIFLLNSNLYSKDLKKVSVQFQWKYQFQFAGYIMAKEKGFYKNIGLDVDMKEWENGINIVDDVMKNHTQYAISRTNSLIDISKGKEIVYLAAIFQSTPLILLADKSSGITSIKDFKNRKIMTTGDMNTDTAILSMLNSKRITLKDLEIQKPSFNVKDLIDKKTDIMTSYISNEPFVLKELGGEPVIFSPKDYGFDFYSDILITSKKYLQQNPQEVREFRKATLKGWKYAFEHIDETVNIIYNKYNAQNKSKNALIYEGKELKKLAYYKTDELGKISVEKLEKIYDIYKLFGLFTGNVNLNEIIYNELSIDVTLTKSEIDYLNNKQKIKMCIDPNWMPFERFDEKGEYIGITSDYYKLFSEMLSTKFEVIKTSSWSETLEYAKQRKCDILSLAMETPERKKYLNFTTPYLTVPLVVVTKLNVQFINEIKDLKGKKIGITKGYAFIELLRNKYPFLDIIEVENIDDGLSRVKNGKLFAYIGTLASVGYKFQTDYFGELKVTGKINENWELGIAVRDDDPVLLSILQKVINNLTSEQKREILNKWISIKYEKGVDYSLVWKIVIISFVLILWTLFWNRKLKNANLKLKEMQKELKKLVVTDRLTNIYNRHKIDEVLNYEKTRTDRYGHNFGIIILDIDLFKNVNDKFGHQVGDKVLIEFSNILLKNKRESDVLGRWGGEEFLIIVPYANKSSIVEFANFLKEKIESHDFDVVHNITASLGVSLYKENKTVDDVILRADKALYISKNSGRNMVTFQ